MKTYRLNMTLSTPKNIEESEILDKLVQFAEDNNYLLGGGLQLVDEDIMNTPSQEIFDEKKLMDKLQKIIDESVKLTLFDKLITLEKEFPNDSEFGREVRRIVSTLKK